MPNHLHRATEIDSLATSALLTPNPLLTQALENSTSNNLPPITISPLQGQYLSIQCQLLGAKSILEIGTLGGYSTIWFASTGAHVTSIEINPAHHAVALSNTASLPNVELLLGDALEVLPQLVSQGKVFDFVFIDASWEEQGGYFDWAVKLTREGGAVYVDNVVREMLEQGDLGEKEGLVTRVGGMEGVRAALVSTVSGHKGKEEEMMDGFLLAVVEKK
ncbi:hypothetical protein EG329_005043 [Mollisiaceae sp. DMI_Dod_QoI]|nr:hypothetical protein EG329_005043 [Helotiales sp. DMI_Dod_QoI]